MQFYRRLSELRKRAGWSQEQLAEKAGVSRQTIFKWENGLASPSMENLLTLSRLFSVSTDELLGNEAFLRENKNVGEDIREEAAKEKPDRETGTDETGRISVRSVFGRSRFEYKSKRTLFGLPLVHICVGAGICRAKGIVAIGNIACGLLSVGILSAGLISFGALAAGALSVAALAVGGFSIGAIALGLFAVGGVAIGIVAVGGMAVGAYSAGGAAFASKIAVTSASGYARAPIAVSPDGAPKGKYELLIADYDSLVAAAGELFPSTPRWLLRLFAMAL